MSPLPTPSRPSVRHADAPGAVPAAPSRSRAAARAAAACLALGAALLAACGPVGGMGDRPRDGASGSAPIRAADPERGQALYENRCGECHSQSVHNRSARAARDFTGVLDQVRRWDRNLGARWTDEDIRDVTVYLTMTFYKYPCPAPMCSAARTHGRPPVSLAAVAPTVPAGD